MNNLLDSDGENQAVRCFLLHYQNPGVSIGALRNALRRSGFDGCWPDWVNGRETSEPITKAGAQLWIRHLFDLEKLLVIDSALPVAKKLMPYGFCVVVMLKGQNREIFRPNRIHRSRIVNSIDDAEQIKIDWLDWERSGMFSVEIITLYDEPLGIAMNKQTLQDAKRWQTLISVFENEIDGFLQMYAAPVGYDSAKLMWVEFGVKAPEWEKPTAEFFTAGVDAAIRALEAKEQSA